MANVKAKLSPQEVFNNKKVFSNKIHTRVLKVIEDISKALDNLKISNDEDKNLFLDAVNHYFHDLCAVIFHLRQVAIKIDEHDQGVQDLQNVITDLNKIAVSIQGFLHLETGQLITQLKGTVVDIGSQVESLMKIVKYDNLHDHKQKVLDCQHDLAISAEALKLYCQCSYLSFPEIEELVHEEIKKVKNSLIKINSDHDHLAEEFRHYTRHSINNFQNAANYVQKMINTEHFHIDMAHGFKIAYVCGSELTKKLLEALCDENPMRKMLDAIENCHNMVSKGSRELQTGFQNATKERIGTKDNGHVKQLLSYIFIHGMNSMSALNQSIEDAIAKN